MFLLANCLQLVANSARQSQNKSLNPDVRRSVLVEKCCRSNALLRKDTWVFRS
jgi:hypothetical protein